MNRYQNTQDSLVFDRVLQFPDGTYYTGYASTLEQASESRTKNINHALTYTEKRAYEIKDSFPECTLTVIKWGEIHCAYLR